MTAGGGVDAAVEVIIDRVGRENSIDGMDGDSWDRLLVRAAIADTSKRYAELIAADREYDAARRAWDDGCFTRWDGIDNSARTKIADRFESATARRASALAAVGQQS